MIKNQKVQGFTLVEMSIVLVIIGLLVGGILVGQSMIDSVRISRFASEITQYEVAINQFKSKFRGIPGDSKFFTPAGDGNGFYQSVAGCTGLFSRAESMHGWAHLSQAQMLNKKFSSYSPVACGGPHNNNTDDISLAGVIAPYTEMTEEYANSFGLSTRQMMTMGVSSGNIWVQHNFLVVVKPEIVAALTNKLPVYRGGSNGLSNIQGPNMCGDATTSLVDCLSPNAVYGAFEYYIAP